MGTFSYFVLMKMNKCLLFVITLIWSLPLLGQQVVKLYEQKPSESSHWTWEEDSSATNLWNTKVVYNVVDPTLQIYLPPYYLANGTAVIVAPGGAFHTLSIDNEGRKVAEWLNSKGVAAFVLKYRLARSYTDDPVSELMAKMANLVELEKVTDSVVPLAMKDGLTAIEYVRNHASDFEVDSNKIGIMGFSAGATLAMSVAYNGSDRNKPNFVVPV